MVAHPPFLGELDRKQEEWRVDALFGRFFQVYEFFDHDVIEGFPSATVPLYPRRCVKSYEGYLAIVLLHPKGFAPQLHGIADLP